MLELLSWEFSCISRFKIPENQVQTGGERLPTTIVSWQGARQHQESKWKDALCLVEYVNLWSITFIVGVLHINKSLNYAVETVGLKYYYIRPSVQLFKNRTGPDWPVGTI